MPEGYEIPFEDRGLDKVFDKLDRLGQKIEDVSKKSKDLVGTVGGVGTRIRDPFERARVLGDRLSSERASGKSDEDLKALRYEHLKASRNVDRIEKALSGGANAQEKLAYAINSSRLSLGGVSPLAGRLASVAGLDPGESIAGMMSSETISAISKVAIPAAVAVAAGVGAYRVAEAASASIARGRSAYWTGGGTASETAQLLGIGGNASRAAALSDSLMGGGLGAAFMRSRGIVSTPYTVDKTKNYLRMVEELRNIKDEKYARLVGMNLGMEQELAWRDLSPSSWEALKGSMSGVATPEARRAQAEYEATKTRAGNVWDNVVRNVGGHYMKVFADIGGGFMDMFSDPEEGNKKLMRGFGRMLTGGATDHIAAWGDSRGERSGGGSSGADGVHTSQVRGVHGFEMFGGGSYGGSAIPAGWKYYQMENALEGQVSMLGGWSP